MEQQIKLSYEELKIIVKYISKESKIKPQKLLCYKTQKLTLIGTTIVSCFLIQYFQKVIQLLIDSGKIKLS